MEQLGWYVENTPPEVGATESILNALAHPLPLSLRKLVARYLRSTYLMAVTSPGFKDAISGEWVNESKNLRTNGIEAWTEDLAYYVERYGLDPGEGLVSHAQSRLGEDMSNEEKRAALKSYRDSA